MLTTIIHSVQVFQYLPRKSIHGIVVYTFGKGVKRFVAHKKEQISISRLTVRCMKLQAFAPPCSCRLVLCIFAQQ